MFLFCIDSGFAFSWVAFHRMSMIQFVYPYSCQWAFAVLLLAIINTDINIRVNRRDGAAAVGG